METEKWWKLSRVLWNENPRQETSHQRQSGMLNSYTKGFCFEIARIDTKTSTEKTCPRNKIFIYKMLQAMPQIIGG